MTSSKYARYEYLFQRMHRHLIANWPHLKSLIWVECQLCGFHDNNSTMQEHVYKKTTRDLNWNREWLRSGADFQLTRAHTSGENNSRHVSRLSDSILNSCCILYLRLLFIVGIDSKCSTIEKSRRNDWRISILLCWCYVYNCLIRL